MIVMPILSIIIVNYKSWEVLQRNLESLLIQKSDLFHLEVIVIDNCSNDGKFDLFAQKYAKVKFILNSGNWGFAHGCNLGAANAKGDYLLFLNPDTIAGKSAIESMYAFYISDASNGILSCKQSEKVSSYQKIIPRIYTLFGIQRSIFKLIFRNRYRSVDCNNKKFVSPDWISGSVIFISRNWFDKVGGWNHDYWMYSEDVELSRKVKKLDGKLRLLCDVSIQHDHGAASRINLITTSLTKTEVLISQHVYVHNNFGFFENNFAQFILVLNSLIFRSLLGLLGIVFFFIPKAKVQVFIFFNLIKYYLSALKNLTWLSSRSYSFLRKEAT